FHSTGLRSQLLILGSGRRGDLADRRRPRRRELPFLSTSDYNSGSCSIEISLRINASPTRIASTPHALTLATSCGVLIPLSLTRTISSGTSRQSFSVTVRSTSNVARLRLLIPTISYAVFCLKKK